MSGSISSSDPAILALEPQSVCAPAGGDGRTWRDDVRMKYLGLIDQAVVSGTRFATTVAVGRVCDAGELGTYTLAFSLMLAAVNAQDAFAMGPLVVYGSRLEGQRKARYCGSVSIQAAILAALTILALSGTALAFNLGGWGGTLRSTIALMAGVVPFVLLQQFGRRFSLAELDLPAAFLVDAVTASLHLAGLALLVLTGTLSAPSVFAVNGLACALPGLVWLFKKRRNFNLPSGQFLHDFRQNWIFGRWMLASQLTGVVGAYAMGWLLALLLDFSAAGSYAACVSIVCLANPILLGLGNVLVPEAAHAFAAEGYPGVRRVSRKAMLLLVGMTALLVLVLLFFGQAILAILYGAEYAASARLVSILAFGALFNAINLAANPALLATERSDLSFAAGLIGVGVACAIGLLAIPWWGLVGAACGSVAGSAAAATFMVACHESITRPACVAGRTP